MKHKQKPEENTLSAILTGAVLAAGAIILSSPEARRKIRTTVREWLNEGDEAMETAKKRGQQMMEEGREKLADTLEQATDRVRTIKKSRRAS
jgi:gas vesicle protein